LPVNYLTVYVVLLKIIFMYKIDKHPILEVRNNEKVKFLYNGKEIEGEKGFTIAAALHQAGFPVHSHSLENRKRSLECGIGKCGACEMLVDGQIKRICITKVNNVNTVNEIPKDYKPEISVINKENPISIYKTNVLTIGAGNIGYLTSYQLMQAGAKVKAILEAMPFEGGFPVQANRVRRLGIPIEMSTILLKAIPNEDHTGITGAIVADCENFQPIPGTERIIDGIDAINICTGLVPDDQPIFPAPIVKTFVLYIEIGFSLLITEISGL